MQRGQRFWYAFSLVFILGGMVLGGWLWLRFSHQNLVVNAISPHTAPSHKVASSWKGGRLVIPSLNINAPIEFVGRLADGSMAVPTQNQWENVGWYKFGSVPGEQGNSVIDGHLDRPGGAPAVFWRLHELQKGDNVTVVNTQGKTLHFRVTDVQSYTPDAAPRERIFGATSGSSLNLITCAGQWIPARQQTTERLVVYTALVP